MTVSVSLPAYRSTIPASVIAERGGLLFPQITDVWEQQLLDTPVPKT